MRCAVKYNIGGMLLKGYLGSFFFDKFGFDGTTKLGQKIRQETGLELYIPQENGEINDKKNNDGNITAETIYQGDTDRLIESDILIACVDGVEIDSGLSTEIGLVAGYNETCLKYGIPHKPKFIIGYYTDCRQFGTGDNHMYKNLYTMGAIEKFGIIVNNENDLINEIKIFMKYN
jgi:hypothetical protein